MKRNVFILLIIASILIVFSTLIFASGTIEVKDYIKGKLPSIFSFYLSSLEELDLYEKEFIDLLEKLPEEEQEYYAKEVYENGFSLELLKEVKDGKKIQIPTSNPPITILPPEKPIESLPSLIKRIKPSTVIIFAYDNKGEFLKLGSGFFISKNGDVITNYHVIQGASSAEIKTADGKTYPITYILAGDEQNDLIRLSVNIPSQSVYPLTLSKTIPEVGERVIVYGSPLGLENTVSDGIVSAIRDIPDYGRIIQITAPISPGSSGSPVLNLQGEVIGIASFQMVEGQNLNFAIPSEKIANLNLKEEKKTFTTEKDFGPESKAKINSEYDQAYQKALYFIDKKEYDKAVPYIKILIEMNPLDAGKYCALGMCYEKIGSYKDAIEAFKQAIHIDPNDADAQFYLGHSYSLFGLYKDAIEAFKQAIRIDPDYVNSHVCLGLTYSIIGDISSALNEYKILKNLDIDKANELFDLIY
jgi:tetratricopeptide (TPR) repeat protein